MDGCLLCRDLALTDGYRALLAQCELELTIDTLKIVVPTGIWADVVDECCWLSPLRLEVVRVEFWSQRRLRLWMPADWWAT